MAFFSYGQSTTPIGADEVFVRCPSCEKNSWADMMVESQYFHMFWVPIFPFDKLINLICKDCGLRRYGLPFNESIIPTYKEIEHQFRHPVRTFIPVLIVVFLVIVAIVV